MKRRLDNFCLVPILVLSALIPSESAQAVGQGRSLFERAQNGFERNLGQWNARARFVATDTDYSLFLTDGGATIVPRGQGAASVQMSLVGNAPNVQPRGVMLSPARRHSYVGRDRTRWRRNIPCYAKVIYRAVYPGIDLVFHRDNGPLEFDFLVAPGADPTRIAWRFTGASDNQKAGAKINTRGDLEIGTAHAKVLCHAPRLFQMVNGRPRPVAGRFVHRGDLIGFEIATYERTRPLIIDPQLSYASYFGGRGRDAAQTVAVDGIGNVFIAGTTDTPDFPARQSRIADSDLFVAKFSPDGKRLLSSARLGGVQGAPGIPVAAEDEPADIAVGDDGQVVVVGRTASRDFPLRNALQATPTGAFVVKWKKDFSDLAFSTYFGGAQGSNIVRGVALDTQANIYLTGQTTSDDFPIANALQPRRAGSVFISDAFVTKLKGDGSSLLFSTFFGGDGVDTGSAIGVDTGSAIGVDSEGQAVVTGSTDSPDFPKRAAFQNQYRVADAFLAKFSAAGSQLLYSTFLGGRGYDQALNLAVDRRGDAIVVGTTNSPDFPVYQAAQPRPGGGNDAFVARFDFAGRPRWISYLGGSGDEIDLRGNALFAGVAVDAQGHVWVAGSTSSANFPRRDAAQSTLDGQYDAFVSRFDGAGQLNFASLVGGDGADYGHDAALASGGGIWLTGLTLSTNVATQDAFQGALGEDTAFLGDAFLWRISDAAPADLTPPQIAIITPRDESQSTILTTITGTAADADSGIERVVLFLKRSRDGRYWSGRNWSQTPIELTTTLNRNAWERRDGLLTGSNLQLGSYTITAVAFNRAALRATTTHRVIVISLSRT